MGPMVHGNIWDVYRMDSNLLLHYGVDGELLRQ